jgi:hypothetical protein
VKRDLGLTTGARALSLSADAFDDVGIEHVAPGGPGRKGRLDPTRI